LKDPDIIAKSQPKLTVIPAKIEALEQAVTGA
jgi:hypothetical protein